MEIVDWIPLIIAAIAVVIWILFFLSKKRVPNKQVRDFIGQILSVLVSVCLGITVFLFEQNIIINKRAEALKMAVIEEAKIIRETASGAIVRINACNPGVALLPLFPHANIERAATSDYFSEGITRTLLYLDSNITEHNRWIMNGDDKLFGDYPLTARKCRSSL